jgi:hypothetical protein
VLAGDSDLLSLQTPEEANTFILPRSLALRFLALPLQKKKSTERVQKKKLIKGSYSHLRNGTRKGSVLVD